MSSLDVEGKKNFIINNVKNLHKYEQIQIFKIFKNNDIKFSENSNGVFINLNYLTEGLLDRLIIFIKFCQKNKVLLDKEIKKREQLKQIVKLNHQNLKFNNSNNCNNKTSNISSINYESGIKYQDNDADEENEPVFQEKTIVIPQL